MKFLSLHINTEPTWRGGEQQTLYLLQGLRRRGYPVALVAAPGSPLFRRAREAGLETYGIAARSEADIMAVWRVVRILLRLSPGIIHMHTSRAHALGVCAAILSRSQSKRVVSRRVNFSIYRHWFLGLNWIKYCYGVDRYLAVSQSVREVLARDGVDPRRIRVVYSGVDPERFAGALPQERSRLLKEWELPPEMPLVGSIGALVPYKGFREFVEAAAEVHRRRPCSFVLVGEGELNGELMQRVRRLGLDSCFRLVGFRLDVGSILRALDAFVFPSLEEGLGTSILDALLLSRPTVASRVGGIPEVIKHGENGLLVEPGDAYSLAVAVESLLSDRERARRLGEAGRQTVLGRFHVDSMVEKTLQCYCELIENGAAAQVVKEGAENALCQGARSVSEVA